MFKWRLIVVCSAFLLPTLWVAGSLNSQTKQPYNVPWSVLNEGGKTREATSASYRLKDAIGQSVIGRCESASYKAYIGFWSAKPLLIVGIEEKFGDPDALSLVYSLSQNYPNPIWVI